MTATLPGLRPATLEEAREHCATLARSHYENFTVVSSFFPKAKRQDMFNVYAFCRYSDDLGDEELGQGDRVEALDAWDQEIDRMFAGEPRHPILVALQETCARYSIPPKPLHDLVAAFRMDQTTTRWRDFDHLRHYCRHSADPVGRLVLYVFEEAREETFALSDETCTGLQLANFWQDVCPDLLERDRIYIPQDSLARFGVSEDEIRASCAAKRFVGLRGERPDDEKWRALMKFEVDRARGFFERGSGLLPLVRPELRVDLELFGRGGAAILDAVERQGYDVFVRRPKLSKGKKAWLVLKALVKLKLSRIARRS
jgi:squalene synthase HpnC